jgi:hypothetical protein
MVRCNVLSMPPGVFKPAKSISIKRGSIKAPSQALQATPYSRALAGKVSLDLMSSLPTSLYFTNAAGLVQEYADYVRLQYYPGPRRFEEFTAMLHHVTRALSRYRLGKLLIDQR